MKERLISNLGLKILSLFLAFIIWLVVVNVSNPLVNRRREVTLEIENSEVLTAAKRAYEISGKSTVTVSFDIHTRDEYKIQLSDFRAYIDLSELYDVTGSVPVKVEVLKNDDIYYNVSAKPGVVRVMTEELQTKPFDLRANIQGKAADGYHVDGVALSPDTVTVEGPISQVGHISYVGVQIHVDGLTSDTEGNTGLVFYDANGNALDVDERVRTNVDETGIDYTIYINKAKEVPLEYSVSGNVAQGYRFIGAESPKDTVQVTGDRSALVSLDRITIPASLLDINGATQDRVVTVDIRELLPDGIELAASEEPMVEIRLQVEPLVTKTFELTERDIDMTGQNEDRNYRLVPSQVEVVIQGLSEDLDPLTEEDLGASLRLDGLDVGLHWGNMEFKESDLYTIISGPEFQIEVTLRSGVVEAGTQPQETEESVGESTSGQTSSAHEPGFTEPAAEAGATSGTVIQGTLEETAVSEERE